MKFNCKSCQANFEAATKPKSCPNCFKNKGFDLVVQRSAGAAAVYESEWDAAASQVLATINRAGTLAMLAGQYGLPDVNCLTALYNAIKLPGKAKAQSVVFNAFGANYDSREQKLKIPKPAAHNA